jgi:prepilin-type N-terminal cleavage/methylation domain-containing protein
MKKGLTLIEMLVAMTITLIVLGLTVTQFLLQRGHIDMQERQVKLDRDTRSTLMFVSDELREIGLDPRKSFSFGITAGDSNSITYTLDRDLDGVVDADENGDIRLNADTLIFNGSNVLPNVTNLHFAYFDTAGTPILAFPIDEDDGTGFFIAEVALIEIKITTEVRNLRGKLLAQSNQINTVERKNR